MERVRGPGGDGELEEEESDESPGEETLKQASCFEKKLESYELQLTAQSAL